jgi:CelD/BcsL family acetyltransferase involved in cellulose biosynthesis
VIEIHHQIEPIEAEWEELAVRTGASPFIRPGWFLCWWEAFGSGELSIVALRRQGRLAGVLPVCRSRGAISSPTNWHSDLYAATAEDAAARAALFAAVFELAPRRVELSFLDAESGDVESLVEAADGYRLETEVMMRALFVSVEGDWETYLAGRSGKLRSNLRRSRKRAEELGEVSLDVHDGRERLDELLDVGFRLEASGWKGENGTAIVSDPATEHFYRETARWAAEQGLLALAFIRIDGKAVAFSFGLETADGQYLLKLGQDAELDQVGLGTLVMAEMVSRAFELGLSVAEFMGGSDPYKKRWANGSRELLRARAFAPTPAGRASRIVHTHGRRLAKKALRRGGVNETSRAG